MKTGKGNPEHQKGKKMEKEMLIYMINHEENFDKAQEMLDMYNESGLKIIMSTGKTEREAKRELNRGSYVIELQSFIDDYREICEEERLSAGLDKETYTEEYAEELERIERVIAAVTETAEHIKNFSDGYFETADEFNTVANFDGKQYVIHWTL